MQANQIITLILDNNRLRSALKAISSPKKMLLRFVPVRFGFIVVALRRLLEMKSDMCTLVDCGTWLSYFLDQARDKKVRMTKVRELVDTKTFWTGIQFVLSICDPIMVAMREMDGTCERLAGFALCGCLLWRRLRMCVWNSVPSTKTQKLRSSMLSRKIFRRNCQQTYRSRAGGLEE